MVYPSNFLETPYRLRRQIFRYKITSIKQTFVKSEYTHHITPKIIWERFFNAESMPAKNMIGRKKILSVRPNFAGQHDL